VYIRLLNGLYGRHIGQIAIKGTNMQRIAHVIQMLKTKFSEPIRVEDLAENGPYEPAVFPLSFQRRDDHETPAVSEARTPPGSATLVIGGRARTRQAQLIVSAMKVRRSSVANISASLAHLSVMLPIFERSKD